MNETSNCVNCGKPFKHFESCFLDICDPCAVQLEGKTVEELKKENADE